MCVSFWPIVCFNEMSNLTKKQFTFIANVYYLITFTNSFLIGKYVSILYLEHRGTASLKMLLLTIIYNDSSKMIYDNTYQKPYKEFFPTS